MGALTGQVLQVKNSRFVQKEQCFKIKHWLHNLKNKLLELFSEVLKKMKIFLLTFLWQWPFKHFIKYEILKRNDQ